MIQDKTRLDRAIEYIAPSWAAQRAKARMALGAVASHRGALATRTAETWGTSTSYLGGTSADRLDYANMRSRARNAYQNNPIAKSLLNTETDYVVGDSFTLQSRTDSEEFNDEVEEKWPEWLDKADFRRMLPRSELFRTSWREPRKDGDGGFVLIGSGVESFIQYIPGDRIQSPWGSGAQQLPKGTYLQDGIETDATGRPKAYWILSETELGKRDFTKVLAQDFVYLPHLEEPLGLRGATVYAPIFELLSQMGGYIDAVIIAARMAAIFGLIFKGDNTARELANLTTLTNAQGQQQKAIGMENGQLRMVGAMDDVVQVQAHQPMQQTPDFIRAMFRLICLPFNLPIELGMKDVSQVTFISGRLALRDAERNTKSKQCWLRSLCWYRIYEWWIARERKKQQLGLSEFVSQIPKEAYVYEMIPPPFPVADPLAEGQADLLDISIGKKSPQQICIANGGDFTETQQQIAEARDSNEAKGIPNVLSTLTRDEAPEPVDPADTTGSGTGDETTGDSNSPEKP